jgi:hypothetical protein
MDRLTPEQLKFLKQNYLVVIDQNNGRFAAIERFMFTDGIIEGPNRDAMTGYSRRWCYGRGGAAHALANWAAKEFEGEPEGWHRAVDGTGRRRPHGNKDEEYISF